MVSADTAESAVLPSRQALKEALLLAEEILRNIELGEAPLAPVAFKAGRLARLLNDFETQKTMQFEAGGIHSSDGTVPAEVWRWAIAYDYLRELAIGES